MEKPGAGWMQGCKTLRDQTTPTVAPTAHTYAEAAEQLSGIPGASQTQRLYSSSIIQTASALGEDTGSIVKSAPRSAKKRTLTFVMLFGNR